MIAIMGAMREEIEPLLTIFTDIQKIDFANNSFYICKYQNKDIVLAYSKIGKVNASLTASIMINKFGATKLLFSGVAGAVNPNLKVGDLIIATKLIQHDVDITAFGHPWGFIPESGDYYYADETLNNIAKNVALTNNIKLLDGVIATGDQFIANEERKNWIQNTFNADAIEMEGASVALVCTAMNIPFFVLRAISDAADMDAGFSFDEFLVSSAKESASFLVNMLDRL